MKCPKCHFENREIEKFNNEYGKNSSSNFPKAETIIITPRLNKGFFNQTFTIIGG